MAELSQSCAGLRSPASRFYFSHGAKLTASLFQSCRKANQQKATFFRDVVESGPTYSYSYHPSDTGKKIYKKNTRGSKKSSGTTQKADQGKAMCFSSVEKRINVQLYIYITVSILVMQKADQQIAHNYFSDAKKAGEQIAIYLSDGGKCNNK